MNKTYLQLLVGVALIILLLGLSDFVPFWMPGMTETIILLVVALLLGVWASFVMYEETADEREATYNLQAGRVSYLAGMSVLLLALLVQGFMYAIDPWILIALGVMVVAKLATKLYALWYR